MTQDETPNDSNANAPSRNSIWGDPYRPYPLEVEERDRISPELDKQAPEIAEALNKARIRCVSNWVAEMRRAEGHGRWHMQLVARLQDRSGNHLVNEMVRHGVIRYADDADVYRKGRYVNFHTTIGVDTVTIPVDRINLSKLQEVAAAGQSADLPGDRKAALLDQLRVEGVTGWSNVTDQEGHRWIEATLPNSNDYGQKVTRSIAQALTGLRVIYTPHNVHRHQMQGGDVVRIRANDIDGERLQEAANSFPQLQELANASARTSQQGGHLSRLLRKLSGQGGDDREPGR